MKVEVEMNGEIAVVSFSAQESLDASNSLAVKERLKEIVATYRQVIVDGAALKFVDSSGLGVLLSALRQANSQGGEIKLARLQQPVRVVLELTRMHRIFEIYESLESAVESFS